MNSTNRALNRAFLIVVGAVLLAAGLGVIAMALLPAAAAWWPAALAGVQGATDRAQSEDVEILGAQTSWLLLAVPVAAAILIAVLIAFIARQGRGRTDEVVSGLPVPAEGTRGTLAVDVQLARGFLQEALRGMPTVTDVDVAAYRVRGQPALRLTVTPRRGADPARAVSQLERALAEWDRLLGRRVPVLVHVNAGIRTALSGAARAESARPLPASASRVP